MKEKQIIQESIFVIIVMIMVLIIQVIAVIKLDAGDTARLEGTAQAWAVVFMVMMVIQAFLTSALLNYLRELRS